MTENIPESLQPGRPALTARQLLRQRREQLDALFAASPAGPIPDGEATGTAIAWPGGLLARVIAWFARWFLWQGKVFDAQEGCLRNRITAGQPEKLHTIAKARFKAEPTRWSRVVWRVSFVATRSAMPYGIMAFALLYALPGIVMLAAVGANVYWVSLVLKLRHLLGGKAEAATA